VIYTKLPDVVGETNAKELVKELTPHIGNIPTKGRAKVLYDELIQMITEQQDELIPTWTGDDERNMTWWMIKK
jgi:hypothetical protein